MNVFDELLIVYFFTMLPVVVILNMSSQLIDLHVCNYAIGSSLKVRKLRPCNLW